MIVNKKHYFPEMTDSTLSASTFSAGSLSLERMIESQCAMRTNTSEERATCINNAMGSVGRYKDGMPTNTISPICLHDGPCSPPPTCSKDFFACLESKEMVNKGYLCDTKFEKCVAELSSSPLMMDGRGKDRME